LEQIYGTNSETKFFPLNYSISFSDLVKLSKLLGFNLWFTGHRVTYELLLKVCVIQLIKTGQLLTDWNSLYKCLFLS